MYAAFLRSEYYRPSDFLQAIPASSLLHLLAGTLILESLKDLPRSPHHFDCMPCSATPRVPQVPARLRNL